MCAAAFLMCRCHVLHPSGASPPSIYIHTPAPSLWRPCIPPQSSAHTALMPRLCPLSSLRVQPLRGDTEEKVAATAAGAAQQQASKTSAPAKPAAPHVAKPMGPNVRMETLNSMAELPAKFKRKAFSAEEMAAINVSNSP